MRRGVILFSHGSRDPRWAEPVHALAQRLCALQPGCEVRLAFLELQQPALPEVIDALAAECSFIEVVPVFWAANGHVRRDLPAMLYEARQRHPSLQLTLAPVLSEIPGLLDHLARSLAGVPDHRELTPARPAPGP